ncbi:MAG: DUF4340 domain-containing protein [Ruminococcaceae bacterium]|nr:DUF4340 domain-containing protein [Oscillospiraceae bacterium]
MIKNIKGIIAIAIVAVVLVVALLLLLLFPSKDADSSSELSSEPVKVFEVDKSTVTAIDVKNQNGEISLVKEGNDFKLKGKDSLPQNISKISSVVSEVVKIEATQSVNKAPEDLSIYGLSEPKATITVSQNDGASHTILLGDEALNGGIYLKKGDSDEVFLVDAYDFYCYEYTNLDLYTTSTDTKATNENVKYVKLINGNKTVYELEVLSDEEIKKNEGTYQSIYEMVAPVKCATDTETVSKVINAISGFTFEKVVADEFDNKLLEEYGLLTPNIVFTYKYTVEETETDSTTGETKVISTESFKETIKIGKEKENGKYYAMFEGRDLIYSVSSSYVSAFNDVTTDQMCASLVYITNINTVKNITVEGYNKTYSFDLLNSDAEDTEDMIVKYNGKEYPQDTFRKLYQVIIGTTQNGLSDNRTGSLEATITFNKTDGKKDVISFYKIDDRNMFVKINGEGIYSVNKTSVEKIFSSCEKYINGEKITV